MSDLRDLFTNTSSMSPRLQKILKTARRRQEVRMEAATIKEVVNGILDRVEEPKEDPMTPNENFHIQLPNPLEPMDQAVEDPEDIIHVVNRILETLEAASNLLDSLEASEDTANVINHLMETLETLEAMDSEDTVTSEDIEQWRMDIPDEEEDAQNIRNMEISKELADLLSDFDDGGDVDPEVDAPDSLDSEDRAAPEAIYITSSDESSDSDEDRGESSDSDDLEDRGVAQNASGPSDSSSDSEDIQKSQRIQKIRKGRHSEGEEDDPLLQMTLRILTKIVEVLEMLRNLRIPMTTLQNPSDLQKSLLAAVPSKIVVLLLQKRESSLEVRIRKIQKIPEEEDALPPLLQMTLRILIPLHFLEIR
uniref:GON-4-like protein n=1 Tax=Caenorhabditis tropicalis TaxID=1561998 RepID=A0A1I7T7D1_9PELO